MKDSEQPGASDIPLSKTATQDKTSAGGRSKKSTARPRTFWTYAKWTAAATFCTLAMAVGAVLGNFVTRFQVHDVKGRHDSVDLVKGFAVADNFPADKQHGMNILIMGCDHDYYDNKPAPILSTPGRSDALMVAHVDFDKQTIDVLSIPRDTAVHVPGYRGVKKVNSAHSFGGANLTKETVKSVFGIDTDYYVGLNYEGFQQLIDAIGGVDLTVEKQLDYDDNWGDLHVHLKPGAQHLSGYQAMGYVRIRHTDDDFHRQERQHAFLVALQHQVMSMGTLMKLPDALNALTNNLDTDMKINQLMALGNFARGLGKENIQLSSMPSKMGRSFVYIDKPKTAEVVRKMFFADNQYASIEINAPDVAGTRRSSLLRNRRHHRRHADAAVSTDVGTIPQIDSTTPGAASPAASDSPDASGGSTSDTPPSGGMPSPGGAGGVENSAPISHS